MSAYFSYLGKMIVQIFIDIGTWFSDWVAFKYSKLPDNFARYGDYFSAYSPDFGVGGWIMFVVFALLLLAVIGAIGFGLFILIRKYVRFVKGELDKDELKRQVERLNYELYQIMQERDRILDLKVKALGIKGMKKPEGEGKEGEETSEAEETMEEIASRFPKLSHVDHEYQNKNTDIPEVEGLTLKQLCENFRNFAASQLGLYYTINTIRQLFAGIGASKLVILEGISGTGKTSMPYALGKFFAHDAEICSVQPNWKDRSELLGYYNEFTKKFNESEFLRALYTVAYRKDLNIIVLDEMNLARVEYYFAEFLSVLEMPNPNEWNIEMIGSHDVNDPKLFKNGKLKIKAKLNSEYKNKIFNSLYD